MKRHGHWFLVLYLFVAAVVMTVAALPFLEHLPAWLNRWESKRAVSLRRQAFAEKNVIGSEVVSVVRYAISGWAVLLSDPNDQPDQQSWNQSPKLAERTPRIALTADELQYLRNLVLSEKSYEFSTDPNELSFKPCMPTFGARLIFSSAHGAVTVNFCFDCYILQLVLNDGEPKETDFKTREFARFFGNHFASDEVAVRFR